MRAGATLSLLWNAEREDRDRLDMTDLGIALLWSTLGLILSVFIFNLGFGPALAGVLALAG